MNRRQFLGSSLAAGAGLSVYCNGKSSQPASYFHHGRTADYTPFQIIDQGRKITQIETFTLNYIGFVRITTDDGKQGWGQISTYNSDIAATILHRQIARHFLGKDPADLDQLVDRTLYANLKYPWSFVCRAMGGIDTAIWDLYGKITGKPVVTLLGGEPGPLAVYGSSMRRDITPEDEAARLQALRDQSGYRAFKVRAGSNQGYNQDQWDGRTEELIPAVRNVLGDEVDLLIDANSCYTPDKAIEVGRLLEDNNYYQFEEPCPYWELEWTREVTKAISVSVSGGEQDNDLAQWRRMINMHAVDIVQPDPLYLGGITSTWRVAKMAQKAGLKFVPHSANHGLVTLFALHLMKALPEISTPYLEYSIEFEGFPNPQVLQMYTPHLDVENGMVMLTEAPGWGVEINREWLATTTYGKSEI